MREAEALFRAFAARHSLRIEKIEEPNIELLMSVPRQPGLSFDLELGLQNDDEVNIGFEGFWSYIFPFEKRREHVDRILDGLMAGDARLATHRQFGRWPAGRVLELRESDGTWRPVYWDSPFKIPFVPTEVTYVYNDAAKSRSS